MTNFSSYVTSKGAIWRLTETLGAELAPFGIFVNAIAPGAVDTRMFQDVIAAGPEKIGAQLFEHGTDDSKKNQRTPDKAVQLALYLLSEKSKGLYGKVISAVYDPYSEFEDNQAISTSDLFTMRRVTRIEGKNKFAT